MVSAIRDLSKRLCKGKFWHVQINQLTSRDKGQEAFAAIRIRLVKSSEELATVQPNHLRIVREKRQSKSPLVT
jgi:hypothetical protein